MRATLIFSYIAQVYISILGILLVPVYLRYLGSEGVGLIGFYVMLQAWIPIFDLGLTPVLSREISRFHAGVLNFEQVASRLRTIEIFQCMGGLSAIFLLWLGSEWLGTHWLSSTQFSESEIARCIVLIGGAIALRWLSGGQRAVLVGLELQRLVNWLGAGFATLRFIGALPLLIYVSTLPEHFFMYQVIIGILELAAFLVAARCVLPDFRRYRPDWHVFYDLLPMIGNMAFLTAMWAVMTQIDKFILSGLLPLESYGNFTLAVMAANGLLILIVPLSQVLQPRFTILTEKKATDIFVEIYRTSSQFSALGFISLGGGLAFFAEPILYIWTGNRLVAQASAQILFWYGLANAIIGVLVIPFMLQFAKGQLRLHVIGNLILLFTMIPGLIFAARHWGAVGAGQIFFFSNLLFLVLWIPIVHRRFLPMLTWRWFFADIFPVSILVLTVQWCGSIILAGLRPDMLAGIVVVFILSLIFGMLTGSRTRKFILELDFWRTV